MNSDIGLHGSNSDVKTIELTAQETEKAIADGKLIPLLEERKEIYYCNNKRCLQWYEKTIPPVVTCCVIHPPGSCCHVGERVLSREEVKKLIDKG